MAREPATTGTHLGDSCQGSPWHHNARIPAVSNNYVMVAKSSGLSALKQKTFTLVWFQSNIQDKQWLEQKAFSRRWMLREMRRSSSRGLNANTVVPEVGGSENRQSHGRRRKGHLRPLNHLKDWFPNNLTGGMLIEAARVGCIRNIPQFTCNKLYFVLHFVGLNVKDVRFKDLTAKRQKNVAG